MVNKFLFMNSHSSFISLWDDTLIKTLNAFMIMNPKKPFFSENYANSRYKESPNPDQT